MAIDNEQCLQSSYKCVTLVPNAPMRYTESCFGCKTENVLKNVDIFLIISQNIDCGYKLEPHRRAVLMSTHNLCFGVKIKK